MLNQSADPFGIIGQVLDSQFRVDRLVGEGGFSAVYRGHHLGLDEPIAIKCLKLPPSLSQDLVEQFERRFRDESRILYRLSQGNLNIVRSIAGGTWQSPVGFVVPFMVLEWMEGRSLANEFTIRRTVGKQGRSLEEVIAVFGSAADGLAHAHAQGVIHRDLNPGNFFFTSTPQGQRLKVLDFGVAKILDDSTLNIERTHTVGQIRIFAPAYGAPEQFDDTLGRATAATDVYAFALILLEALRDRAVNDGTHLGEFAMRAVDPVGRPTPRALGIDVPADVEDVFARATRLKPEERWQSAGELWAALTDAASTASKQRHQQAAFETPALEMPQVGRHTQQGMAPPAQAQKGKAPMKRMDKTLPVGAVLPPVPGAPAKPPLPPLPPSAPRVPAARSPEHPDVPQLAADEDAQEGGAEDEATRIGATPADVQRQLPEDMEDGEEVTRVGAPAADVLRGLADVGVAPVTMAQVSNGNQGPRPAAGHPLPPDPSQQQPGYPQQQQRAPQPMAGTMMMPQQGGFGPLPPPPQAARPPMQQPGMPPNPAMGYGQQPGMPPPGQMPPAQTPPGQMPPGQMPPGQMPPGQMPPGQMPPGQMQQPPPGYGMPPQQQPAFGQQPSSQQQPAFAQPPGMETSIAPQIPKKSNAILFVGLGLGLIVLLGVVAAVYVVAAGPKPTSATTGSASASAAVSAVPTMSAPPPATVSAEPAATAPTTATDDAGAVAEVEVDSGTTAANAPPENNGAAAPANPGTQPVVQNWQPAPAPAPAVKDAGPPVDPNAFNPVAAQQSLRNANGILVFCKKEGGVTGPGSATVTFNPDGSVANVAMDAPYAGTPTGECVSGQFKRAHTSSFQGSPQSVKHTFEVPK